MHLDREVCERAMASRDERFDGRFFIGVLTTRIYCRPVCPVKAPQFKNVRFYASAAAAAEAGLRPCLRCRPESAPGTPAWLGTSATVARALRLISDGALQPGGVPRLAASLGIGSRHLTRLFQKHVGASPSTVAQTHRLHRAKKLLDETDLGMTEISLAAGYGSVRRFNAAVKRTYGRTPSEIRRGAPRRANATPALTLRLGYRTPFDVPWIFGFLAARAIPGVEQVDRDGYCRSLALGDKSGTIRVRPISGQDALELEIEFPDPARLFEIVDRVKRIFDLDAVPAEIAGCLGRDRRLGPLVRQWPGLRVPGAWDGFEIAVRAILGQQVSVQAATTLAGRLARCHGRPLARRAGDGPTHLFPTAEALARADPKTFGVPTARARAIGGLARAVCEGEVDFDRPADLESFVAGLTRLTGIGDWTAHYVAMRAAREPDAFPANDLGLLRAFAEDGRSLTRRRLQARAESWRPWRAYAAIYLWKADACRDDALERRHAL